MDPEGSGGEWGEDLTCHDQIYTPWNDFWLFKKEHKLP